MPRYQTYARGDRSLAECPRCGNEVPYKSLMRDGYFPSLWVCTSCWEPADPLDRLKPIHDSENLHHPQPVMVSNRSLLRIEGLQLHAFAGAPTVTVA